LSTGDQGAAAGGGIQAAQQGTRLAAWEPLRPGGRRPLGALGQDSAQGLGLRHAPGRQEMAQGLQEALRWWGMPSAPAVVRAPAGQGGAERCIRTLKEHLCWLTTCETVAALRLALHALQGQYHATWLLGRQGSKAPAQVRQEPRCALADAASC
jgi:putative transposase